MPSSSTRLEASVLRVGYKSAYRGILSASFSGPKPWRNKASFLSLRVGFRPSSPPTLERFLSGDSYPALAPALPVLQGWVVLLHTGLPEVLEVLEPGFPRLSETTSACSSGGLSQERVERSAGCCPSIREKLVF